MKLGNSRGIARTTIIIIAVAIIIIAAVAAGVYLYIQPEGVEMERVYPDHTKLNLETETPYIGYVPLGIYNPWDELNLKAFEWYCGDVLGWDYKVYWPDADVKTQNDMAEMAIAEGVDALVVCPLDSMANAKIGDMAREADIPVVEFGIDMYNSWPLVFYQRDDKDSGFYCGTYMVDKLEEMYGDTEGLKVLHIHGYRGSTSDFLRSAGFIDAITDSGLDVIEVGNSWDAVAEYEPVKAKLEANPDIVAVYEEMGGFHETWVSAATDLGWSEQKIKDIVAVNCDLFPVNIEAYEEGTQDYCHLMPTGGYMMAGCLETLKEFWQHGPEALPEIGDTFTVEKYVPELAVDATVDGFKPLQWFEDPKWGIAGTHTTNTEGVCPIRPATCGGYDTPWVVIPDRIVTEADYMEDFIYWNWPIWEL